jgi:hypothetical protein
MLVNLSARSRWRWQQKAKFQELIPFTFFSNCVIRPPDLAKDGTFNFVRDWLKHTNDNMPDEIEITDFDVVIALVRAASKFIAAYGKGS